VPSTRQGLGVDGQRTLAAGTRTLVVAVSIPVGRGRRRSRRAYRSVSTPALSPCRTTEAVTVSAVASTIVFECGTLASTTRTAKTIDARPRGPNQPR
jgi:hypothetical protein